MRLVFVVAQAAKKRGTEQQVLSTPVASSNKRTCHSGRDATGGATSVPDCPIGRTMFRTLHADGGCQISFVFVCHQRTGK